MSKSPGKEGSRPPAQLWVDVGGTFTDAVWVNGGRESQTLKTPSDGSVPVRLGAAEGDRRVAVVGGPELSAGFWIGAEVVRGERRWRVLDSGAGWLEVERDAKALAGGDAILDAGLAAPVLAAHRLSGVPVGEALPAIDVRLGTTRGTNALLTRSGAAVTLVATRGFGDVSRIGTQDRPDLFALRVVRPTPLMRDVVEVDARRGPDGEVWVPLDEDRLRGDLTRLFAEDPNRSLAVSLVHANVDDADERRVEAIAREVGFTRISRGAQLSSMRNYVGRTDTAILDAYLNPTLADYLATVREQFGPNLRSLSVMTSGGNLVDTPEFRGRDSLLSGPAGGGVALADLAGRYGGGGDVVGLDMGGTSTDVCHVGGRRGAGESDSAFSDWGLGFEGGKGGEGDKDKDQEKDKDVCGGGGGNGVSLSRRFESVVDGVRVLTPMMDIETVAAGGGSVCGFRDRRLFVGPESAGADPGPACYGRGGPLTVTDCAVVAGRMDVSRFPFALDVDAARRALEAARVSLPAGERPADAATLAESFLRIAVTHMAEAVRTVTTARGGDVRGMTLVGFGGAAGAHLTRVADALGITRVLDPPDAGVMSAVGMGLADVGEVREAAVYGDLAEVDLAAVSGMVESLKAAVSERLEGCEFAVTAELRYAGTDTSLGVPWGGVDEMREAFERLHRRTFGFESDAGVEMVLVRVEGRVVSRAERPGGGDRVVGETFVGPALVASDQSTLVVDEGWTATVLEGGVMEVVKSDASSSDASSEGGHAAERRATLVDTEIVARRLRGVAEAGGEMIRRTARSVNVKERRDYSCGVFDTDGTLLAGALHVPVHLGAMGRTASELQRRLGPVEPGDVYVTNDPYAGGSHLPDVTVVVPVFDSRGVHRFGVAVRAHHAEIGGIAPGSMPPDATNLAEEGVVIPAMRVGSAGGIDLSAVEALLAGGPYPSRSVAENLGDLHAQIAAARSAASALEDLMSRRDGERLIAAAGRITEVAGDAVGRWIESLPEGVVAEAVDSLDDGWKIGVRIERRVHESGENRLAVHFETDGVHPNGYNAPPAVSTAALLYVVQCLVARGGTALPLCDGLLRDIDVTRSSGLLDPRPGDAPEGSPAVVAGNVETSNRVVDVLLAALAKLDPAAAVGAAGGTMNNTILGDGTFGYYETTGNGAGATAGGPGASAVQTHMTNTRLTDVEVLESRYPVRLWECSVRVGSGGDGEHRGGDGMVRRMEFTRPLTVSLLTNRRVTSPPGAAGGGDGSPGANTRLHRDGRREALPPSVRYDAEMGEGLIVETPGGGGWGTSV